jgi:hypothetical protein
MLRRNPNKKGSRGLAVETEMRTGFNSGRAIVALKRAMEETFDDGRWQELGYLLGKANVVQDHPRLLRSLYWGDPDYGGCIFDVLPELLGWEFKDLGTVERFVGLRDWLQKHDAPLYGELYDDADHPPVVSLDQVEQASAIHDVTELNKHAARIRKGIVEDHEQAIGSAKELLETVLKTVIGDHKLKPADDINALLKKARVELDLDPKAPAGTSPAADSIRRTLSSLGQIIVGVAEVRTLYGTGHGRSKSHELEIAHARLVVNAAISIATFLLEVWQDRNHAVSF